MGHRICCSITSLALLAAASCASPADLVATDSISPSAMATTSGSQAATPTSAPPPPYRAARAEMASGAEEFLRAVVEYDSRHEARLAFIDRLGGIASGPEQRRLAHSPRARLPWRILRARGERTRLTVNGATLARSDAAERRVIVQATVTTRTSFATVSDFRRYTVILTGIGSGWLVTDAEGLSS